jgi:hypothetical protein
MNIKIKPVGLWAIFAISLVFTSGYFYLHFRVTTPVGDIEVEEKLEKGSRDNSNDFAAPVPTTGRRRAIPKINVSAAYQPQGSLKTYIVSQDEQQLTFFECHPIFGNINVGNGTIEGDEIVFDFFSSEAYEHIASKTTGTLRLRYDTSDHSLRGALYVGGEKKEDVILLPQN